MRSLISLTVGWAFLGIACGAEAPEPKTAPSAARSGPARPAKSAKRARSLSPQQVRRVMDEKALEMSGCYELADDKAGALGTLTVEFEVGADGRVRGERFADGGRDVLRECVLKVVKDARFPEAGAPTDVSWPLRFKSRAE